jgi:predicted transposase YbfD/YdcC
MMYPLQPTDEKCCGGSVRSVFGESDYSLVRHFGQREVDGQPSTEYRFYIGSIGTDAARFARAVRGHWGIENDLHWSLDVAFREDESRLRDPQARESFAVLRHMALSRLKNDKQEKMGIKNKRLKAGWDEEYLSAVLFQSG